MAEHPHALRGNLAYLDFIKVGFLVIAFAVPMALNTAGHTWDWDADSSAFCRLFTEILTTLCAATLLPAIALFVVDGLILLLGGGTARQPPRPGAWIKDRFESPVRGIDPGRHMGLVPWRAALGLGAFALPLTFDGVEHVLCAGECPWLPLVEFRHVLEAICQGGLLAVLVGAAFDMVLGRVVYGRFRFVLPFVDPPSPGPTTPPAGPEPAGHGPQSAPGARPLWRPWLVVLAVVIPIAAQAALLLMDRGSPMVAQLFHVNEVICQGVTCTAVALLFFDGGTVFRHGVFAENLVAIAHGFSVRRIEEWHLGTSTSASP